MTLAVAEMTLSTKEPSRMRMSPSSSVPLGKTSASVMTTWRLRPMSRMPGQPATAAPLWPKRRAAKA